MAKAPKDRPFSKPTEEQLQGLQELIKMVTLMQTTMQREAPEEYAKMIEQSKQYERRK
jgi:hypothetical protein